MSDPIIIIGTGLAGYQVAREFRKLDTTTPLLIITADAGNYYSKPLLSTALTSGKTATTLVTTSAEGMAQQLTATIMTHAQVLQLKPQHKTIVLHEKEIPYKKLVLACGADVIKPPLTGNAVKEIFSVNHLYHYQEFRDFIAKKKHLTILGAGLIGCEFANDLSNAGYEVHLIAPVKAPLDLLVPTEIGHLLQTALEKNGVHFHLPCLANSVDKLANGHYCLQLSDGRTLITEFVLSAIGLKPHVALAQTADILINQGICVNRYLETNLPDIYAVGDCAEVEGHVLPYITPLLNCSRALAKTLSGVRTAVEYPAMPITVKTPVHPLVVCPPPKNVIGHWEINMQEESIRALFYDAQQKLYGFVLTNQAVKERAALAQQVPRLF